MTPALKEFMTMKADGVFVIGHASALVRIGGKLIAFDPVWNHSPYGEHWTFWPPQISCDEILDQIDAVVISHIHEDHLCDRILGQLRHKPVYIMSGRPQLLDRLLTAGCGIVIQVEPWLRSRINLCDEVEITFIPHSFNTIDSSCIVEAGDFTVYHGNDNFLDHDTLNRIASMDYFIDIAMVPYAFVHWYPWNLDSLTIEEKLTETMRLKKQSLRQAEDFIDKLRPQVTIPTGNSLYYSAPFEHPLNKYLSTMFDIIANSSKTILAVVLAGGTVTDNFQIDGEWGYPRFIKSLNRFLKSYRWPKEVEQWTTSLEKPWPANRFDQVIDKFPEINHLLIVNGVVFDFSKKEIYNRTERLLPQQRTEFYFDEPTFWQWFLGQITFEQAIGTRRFKCFRIPDVYNLKVFEFMNKYL